MFFTYLRRELRRRRKAALVVASGLGLGIALVIIVSSVSSGMSKAQDKVLESLYGLGTDMTVSKAAAAPGSGTERPKFEFDAKESGDDSTQSTDRVMVQGFQTLASTTVDKVGKQDGVADAVGGLSMTVMKVDGQFKRGEFKQEGGTSQGGRGGPGGSAQPQGEVKGGGASFDVNSYTVYGTDVTKQDLGPLTSSKITAGRTFKTTETNGKVAVVDAAYAKEKKLIVGKTVTVHGTKFTIVGVSAADSGDAAADLYVPLQQAQTLADAKDKVTTVYVKAADSQQIDSVKSTIQKNIPGTTVTTSADLADTVSGSLSTASDLASSVGKWLSIAVLIAAFLVGRPAHLLRGQPPGTGVRHAQGTRLEERPGHPPGRRRGPGQRVDGRRPRHRGRPGRRVRRHRGQPHPDRAARLLGRLLGRRDARRHDGWRPRPAERLQGPRHRADRARVPLDHPDRRRPGRGGRAHRGRLRRLARLPAAPRGRPAARRVTRRGRPVARVSRPSPPSR